MQGLPAEFQNRMKNMLGTEYGNFLICYEKPPYKGIRLNPLKCGADTLRAALPFPLRPAPFSPLSYYAPAGAEKIGFLPMHHAGAFYSQEPSAASAVTVLDPRPGERILDLCAAPGGKSTQIAALLRGKGLLWSNEVVRARANALLSNLERCGVRNAVVSSCRPQELCAALSGFFDRVLVDAPCSGEGMFRRDAQAILDWSPAHVEACAARQRAILESAAQAVRENGVLVYSTCTFSEQENEGVVRSFLRERSDFSLLNCGYGFGRPALSGAARRIFPMDGGEGHFVAVLRRHSENPCGAAPFRSERPERPGPAEELWRSVFRAEPYGTLSRFGNRFFLLPPGLPDLRGLGVIRAGVLLGEAKKGRVEPMHAAFMAAGPQELYRVVSFPRDSPLLADFLRGAEIPVPAELKGFCGVAVEGVTTGFGKCSGGRMKNHYPRGLRNH